MKCPRCKREMIDYNQIQHDLYDFFDPNHLDYACNECRTVYPAQDKLKMIRRIKDYLHKYATTSQVEHIAKFLNIN